MTRRALLAAAFLVVAAPAVVARQSGDASPQDTQTTRRRVGLALGGGSARGLAHVGVLEWLEEHRIPVDVIAGTSIGGLVGGGYATGRTAAEVRDLIEAIDWDAMFQGEVEYAQKAFRRKEDRRDFPVRLELGLRDGLRLAPGLDPGHYIGLFLSRLVLPFAAPLDFDDLPIPFRAVASDLEAAVAVELDSGSLAAALRATMAIPAIFEPIEIGQRLLADGGLLNNVPADVTREMGAEVVIAVDVSAPLGDREALRSLVGVANQAIGVMMVARTRQVLDDHANHVIRPVVDDISANGWRRFEEIRQRGYAAAAALADRLAPLSLDPVAWDRHVAKRRRRRPAASVEPAFVRVDGVDADVAADIGRRLEPEIGGALDPVELERRLTTLAGAGRYGSLGYDVVREGERAGLAVHVREKSHGPPFLNLAFELDNRADAVELGFGARLTAYDVGGRDTEARVDLTLGSDLGLEAEYLRPIAGSSLFVAPRIGLRSRTQQFALESDPIASFRTQRAQAGGDLGVTLGATSELRVGYDIGVVDARVRVGTPVLPPVQGREHGARLRWVYDGHDDWIVPSRGTRLVTEVRWLVEAPEQSRDLRQATLDSATFMSVGDAGRIFVALAGATSFGDAASPFYQFTLGGPFRLGAFELDQFRGSHTAYVGGGYMHRLGRLPDLVGGPIHLVGWLESGSAFETPRDAVVHSDLSGGLLVETLMGALLVSGSIGDDGSGAFYVALGRPFW
ncbi:MAG: patatin-like phospholipase family protein [Vicinamibacterales bacterium]|jgi:NTE family protein|nr:patatin-like phospholipase family protein [Vicinamibacterales bacterium]|tara:strand:- start:1684 stop:3894 length:2211 start_codon:yes stop_codon:yes gene_type:complete